MAAIAYIHTSRHAQLNHTPSHGLATSIVDKVEADGAASSCFIVDGVKRIEQAWVDGLGLDPQGGAAVEVTGVVTFGAVIAPKGLHVVGGGVDPVPFKPRAKLL